MLVQSIVARQTSLCWESSWDLGYRIFLWWCFVITSLLACLVYPSTFIVPTYTNSFHGQYRPPCSHAWKKLPWYLPCAILANLRQMADVVKTVACDSGPWIIRLVWMKCINGHICLVLNVCWMQRTERIQYAGRQWPALNLLDDTYTIIVVTPTKKTMTISLRHTLNVLSWKLKYTTIVTPLLCEL